MQESHKTMDKNNLNDAILPVAVDLFVTLALRL